MLNEINPFKTLLKEARGIYPNLVSMAIVSFRSSLIQISVPEPSLISRYERKRAASEEAALKLLKIYLKIIRALAQFDLQTFRSWILRELDSDLKL